MATGKRKDSNGIILNKGEKQLSDGRYRYRYKDNQGEQHDVYSWTLRKEDSPPDGRKSGASLREQEQQIHKDLLNGLKSWKSGMTLNSLIQEYFEKQRPYWADSTWINYNGAFNKHIKPKFGKRKVSNITPDDVSSFYASLLHSKEAPLKISSIAEIDRIIKPALQMAAKKKIISSNPAVGCYGELSRKNSGNRPEQRHALEEEQVRRLLDYIASYNLRYYRLFYLLAWTGCRINEAAALCWCDIDFKREVIYVRRSLQYQPINGKCVHKLKTPKTVSGIREIPMLANVKQILREMQAEQKVVGLKGPDEITTTDLTSFLFKTEGGNLLTINHADDFLRRAVRRYNEQCFEEEALPEISCHILRHSFCCWLCENVEGANSMDDVKYIQSIQSIMGHSDAQTTLNIYAECRRSNNESKHEALKKATAQSI